MNFFSRILLCAAFLLAFGSNLENAYAQTVPELSSLDFLRQGGHVIIFRHATAPFGTFPNGSTDQASNSVESQWWKSCDVNTARQLDIVGRTEATNIGRALRRLNIPVSSIAASEFCRCNESAVLMNTGLPIVISTALTFTLYTNEARLPELTTRVNQVPPAGTNSILVTHGHTVGPYPFDNLQWSDAIIYRPRTGTNADVVGYARYALWARSTTASVPGVALSNPEKITLSTLPSQEENSILVKASKECNISVLNAQGEEIIGDMPLKSARLLNTKGWAQGTYSIVASNGAHRTVHTFVKQ
jgi:broad specificity phosphatase PhoE